ncbi:hypothetical protein [Acetivibrio ethanolgignens]|uniref:Uncharacterized protein n=1 Tax=Acetivibrio ethanolgignens TaxID=290052 RepID=A0A0V8QH12_9FIRM|nr:hypothetical protein [Acetivibrio ethanolgignens]KSV59887.1 hypothetical protein ASU35_07745 [Acetivibrio ethanolgignens]
MFGKRLFATGIATIMMAALMIAPTNNVFAQENKNIDLTNRENIYYDESVGANVIAFTLNKDGSVNYLTKTEADSITKNAGSEDINLKETNSNKINDKIMLRDYRNWYVFRQTSEPTLYTGSLKKVSADLVAPRGGGSITKNVGYTSTHFFSASIGSQDKKSAIQAGATIGWQSSASTSTSYTVNLRAGEKGYIGFYPYYNKVVGDLELHGNWGDGLISTERGVAGYSVKLTSDGEADGLYKFIYK